MTLPADIANLALDSIGVPTIGDLQEGTVEAKAALRIYSLTRQSLLRGANWNFARREALLTLLNDVTGQTTAAQQAAGGPVTVGTGTVGMRPWVYEYAWPTDGLRARWVPITMYPSPTVSPPIMTGLTATPWACQQPSPFVVSMDTVPPMIGVPGSWAGYPEPLPGRGRASQTVILSNQPNAALVYTADILEPDVWDPMFQLAMTAVMGSYLAMPLLADKKLAMQVRAQQVAAAKQALDRARISDGDEGWNKNDHIPDWMRTRTSGYGGSGFGSWAGLGMMWNSWSPVSLGDGSAY